MFHFQMIGLMVLSISTGLAASWFGGSLFTAVRCGLGQCCEEAVLPGGIPDLGWELQRNLFGQHLLVEVLINALQTHFTSEPKKALVLSFHGWSGTGRTYTSEMLVKKLYKHGFGSSFVHRFNGRLHFPLASSVDRYRENLQTWIRGNVSQCDRSIFIFEETDKLPPGLIDSVKPYLDYQDSIDGVVYRRAIFLFISNVGDVEINRRYRELWERGTARADMRLSDFEPELRGVLFHYQNVFQDSSIIAGHLVSYYVPFLPLERPQLELCVVSEAARQGVKLDEGDVEAVLSQLEYDSGTGRLSTTGCKRIHDFVAVLKTRRSRLEL